jgi:uncharacterized protein YjbI with pentapeptide repeats
MSRAEMGRADFTGAELNNVSFEFTNLARATFKGSKLVKIDFSGTHTYLTHFEDANLKYVTQITQVQLEIACGNEATQLPERLSRPASWPCEE